VRRDQSATRATAQPVQWNNRYNLLKMCPLAYWSEGDVWAYLTHHNVPYNPLLDQGYTSLGCVPCTRPATTTDPRAGRWAGFDKTECGLHL
jgi:phosphoadenosine phosphosulfate reductase